MIFKHQWILTVLALAALLMPARILLAQADQGTITGVVQDPSGAVISNASVMLINVDEGQVLKTRSDASGVYVFSPIKIGNYKLTAGAPNFETTTQTNLHLSIQQRLNVVVTLKPGSTSETITVTAEAPLMQTQESSVGQTMDTQTITACPSTAATGCTLRSSPPAPRWRTALAATARATSRPTASAPKRTTSFSTA